MNRRPERSRSSRKNRWTRSVTGLLSMCCTGLLFRQCSPLVGYLPSALLAGITYAPHPALLLGHFLPAWSGGGGTGGLPGERQSPLQGRLRRARAVLGCLQEL